MDDPIFLSNRRGRKRIIHSVYDRKCRRPKEMDQRENELGKGHNQRRNKKTRGRNPRQDNSNRNSGSRQSFRKEDEEETNDFSECGTYDQENEFSPTNHGIYSLLFSEEEKSDEFIDEHQEEEDAQPLKPLITSYRDHRRQDKETVYPLSSELDDQLIGAKYFTEPDKCWGYDNEHVKDENRWEMAKTNQKLFEPMVIFSSPCSPTIPQTKMEEIFLNQKNKCRIDIDDNSETEKQNTEYTRCVQQRSRDNDLFTEPERYTSWATRTKYEGMLNPENQPQTEPMKDNGTDIWPTPTTTTAGFRNFDAEFIQNNEDLTKPQNKRNANGQGNNDIIMLPERLFPDSMDQEFDDKWTFENDDEQFDPIKTLLVHEPKSLHNHFSKVTMATSVNDVIAVNVMNMNLQKWIMMAQDMNITVSNMIKRKKLEIWKDELEDSLIGILRLPSQNTAPIDC